MVLPTARRHPPVSASNIPTPYPALFRTRADNLEISDLIIIEDRPFKIVDIITEEYSKVLRIVCFDYTVARSIDDKIKGHYEWRKRNDNAKEDIFLEPSAFVSVVKPWKNVRAGYLQRKDVISIIDRPYEVIDISCVSGGRRLLFHVIGIDLFTLKKLELLMKADKMVDFLELEREDMALLRITEEGSFEVMTANGEMYELQTQREELGKCIEDFWCEGQREDVHLNVICIQGEKGVFGASIIRELQLVGCGDEGYLLLKGDDDDTEMSVKMPTGEIGDIIGGILKDGKTATLKVRASMGRECVVDGWSVVDIDSKDEERL